MDKLIIRLTVILTSVYFLYIYISALLGVETFSDMYIILFELAICLVMSKQGKYHCRYMKYTAYSVTSCDAVTRADNTWDFLSVEAASIIPVTFITLGVFVPFILALIHFYKVKQIEIKRHDILRGRTEED